MKTLSAALLFGTSGLMINGYISLTKEKRFSQMFDEIEKSPEFDFDYIREITELPTDRMIALCGETNTADCRQAQLAKGKYSDILFSSIVEKKPLEDRFWKSNMENRINFEIKNTKGERIRIKNKENEVILYNLKQISDPIDCSFLPNVRLSPFQQVSKVFGREIKFAEHAILPEERYVFIGNLSKAGEAYEFNPRLILTENKSHFLQHLDKYLIELNTRGRKMFGSAIGIMVMHFLVFRVMFPQKRRSDRKATSAGKPPSDAKN